MRLYQPEVASAAILRTHELGGDEALIKLIGEVSDAGGTAIALNTLATRARSPGGVRPAAGRGHRSRARSVRLHHRAQARGHACSRTNPHRAWRARSSRACSPPRATRSPPSRVAQEAAALDPDTERFAYADTLLRLDRLDEARQELESLRNDASVRDEAELRLGKLAYQMGDMTEAGRRFGSLISSQAAAPEAFFYLSSIAEREGRTDLALEGYSKLAEAGAGLIVRGRAARLLLKRDDRTAAFRMLDEHAAKERSEMLDVEFAKAALLDDTGHTTEAIALLQLALERFPDHPGVRYQIALIQDKAGMQRESVRSFESLLKDRPEDASLLNALGYSLADRNQKLPRAESHDPQGAAGVARQPGVPRQPGLGPFPSRRHLRRAAASRARVPHLSGCRNRVALGRVAVGQRQTVRGARLVGALAGTIPGIQAAARDDRTPDGHEDGAAGGTGQRHAERSRSEIRAGSRRASAARLHG